MRKKQCRKQPLAKQVWQWTEVVAPENIEEEHVLKAYRLRLGKCGACRKNCVGNPLCLRGIGESAWLKNTNYDNYLQEEMKDLHELVRKDTEFVGLKNLGATCYVNTFLQLWFHNLHFRKAVYSFNEVLKCGEVFPQSPCGHLQLIFGMLEISKRKNIDPSPFIKCLGLDTELQQDAQEFSKLLLNLLNQSSEMGDVLCKEFCGEYEYCTKCKFCGNVSKRPSKFYELDLSIQGHNDIENCLKEFLHEELLEKDNQYFCGNCNCRQDATRQIVMKTLPRTLNLQLLRFVFDKTTYTKKKLSRILSFPSVLDLTPYVSSSDESHIALQYDLTAVLIHRGPSAFSGHYIAHIKDALTGLWHKFNDENVDRLKSGKKLNLDTPSNDDFNIDLPKAPKTPKLQKNSHSSKNAYMLVYTRKDSQIPEVRGNMTIEIPGVVKEFVEKDNNDFFATVNAMISDSQKEIKMKLEKHFSISSALKDLYEMDTSALLANCCWVPTSWLKQALSGVDVAIDKVTLDKFICCHGKLDPLKVVGMKCISNQLASVLSDGKSIASPFLVKNDALCLDCVKQRCHILRNKSLILQDFESVTKIVKEAEDIVSGFYIGRYSFRYWKSMVFRRLEHRETAKTENSSEEEGSDNDSIDFNDDLFCEHGNFVLDPKHYRVIPGEAWHILLKYFPDSVGHHTDVELTPCTICLQDSQYAKQETELKKVIVSEQKAILNDLLLYRNRPSHSDLYGAPSDNEEHILFAVTADFVLRWRCFIRNPSQHDMVSSVNNKVMLCPHEKLSCDPLTAFYCDEYTENEIVLLWPSEWDYISKNFCVDIAVSVSKCKPGLSQAHLNGVSDGIESMITHVVSNGCVNAKISEADEKPTQTFVTANITPTAQEVIDLEFRPNICKECILGKRLEREQSSRMYKDKVIYIKRVSPDDKAEWIKENNPARENVGTRKRKRTTARGEKALTVSSDWTLKQLKIAIMQLYSIPPFDQNLWLDSRKLEDDQLTLGSLAVLPESTLIVIADEPDETSSELLPVFPDKAAVTEEGFKGTSLIGK